MKQIQLRYVVLALVFLYVLTCGFLYIQQTRFLYYPTPAVERSDADAILFENDGVALKLWKAGNGTRSAIIYFGGNAENVARNIPPLTQTLPDHDIYLLNYRSYGGNDGKPSEQALFDDALAVYDMIDDDYDAISIIGRSLGSGVAVYLAGKRPTEKLVLITPYDSIERVAQAKFPLIPVSLLLRDKYDSAGRAELVSSPTLIVTAENDGVIPKRHSDRLAHHLTNAEIKQEIMPGQTHLSVSNPQEFWVTLGEFFGAAE